MPTLKQIGKKLRKLRGDASAAELAPRIGISKESIQRYERGDGIPKDYNMAKIAKFYGLKVSELWGKHQEQAQTSKIIARRQGAPADATGEYNNNIYKIGRHGFLYCHLNGEWRRSSNDAGQINKKLKRYAA